MVECAGELRAKGFNVKRDVELSSARMLSFRLDLPRRHSRGVVWHAVLNRVIKLCVLDRTAGVCVSGGLGTSIHIQHPPPSLTR